ncbi:hypothetical protein ARMSODRAFT_976375 [Armillaria solidipes]|uniref:Uncharacterized protein n=1 Tax=Armillaria solidipes TaxID=1076256 RepID=A0A2H3BEM1_9AGAR|nr:hypothetical protein ARMSODRAFT_976375 [Armillaria solidipes]
MAREKEPEIVEKLSSQHHHVIAPRDPRIKRALRRLSISLTWSENSVTYDPARWNRISTAKYKEDGELLMMVADTNQGKALSEPDRSQRKKQERRGVPEFINQFAPKQVHRGQTDCAFMMIIKGTQDRKQDVRVREAIQTVPCRLRSAVLLLNGNKK